MLAVFISVSFLKADTPPALKWIEHEDHRGFRAPEMPLCIGELLVDGGGRAPSIAKKLTRKYLEAVFLAICIHNVDPERAFSIIHSYVKDCPNAGLPAIAARLADVCNPALVSPASAEELTTAAHLELSEANEPFAPEDAQLLAVAQILPQARARRDAAYLLRPCQPVALLTPTHPLHEHTRAL